MKMKYCRIHNSLSKNEAKLILWLMQRIIDEYGYVTLADFGDLVDMHYDDDENILGWQSLDGAKVAWSWYRWCWEIVLPPMRRLTVCEQLSFDSH